MDIAAVLQSSAWFARQPADLRAALIRAGRVVRLAAGQWVYGEGDEDTGLCAILSGALRLEASAARERDVLIGIAPAVSVLGQSRRRGGGPRIISARAASASIVMLISDDALERIGYDQPALWRAVSELVYDQLDASVHLAAQLLVLEPRARVAMRIATIATGGVAPIGQADLAELTGLSRKAVNAHLGAMEAAGVVKRGYRRVRVSMRRHWRGWRQDEVGSPPEQSRVTLVCASEGERS